MSITLNDPKAEHGKLIETHAIRVPVKLKHHLDLMGVVEKSQMHKEIRELMAKHVHVSKFNPDDYLSD